MTLDLSGIDKQVERAMKLIGSANKRADAYERLAKAATAYIDVIPCTLTTAQQSKAWEQYQAARLALLEDLKALQAELQSI